MVMKEVTFGDAFSEQVERFFVSAQSVLTEFRKVFATRVEAFASGLRHELSRVRGEIEYYERTHANRFNVFDYINPDENRLSDIIADMLDPKGKHGQFDLFLRSMLRQCCVVIHELTISARIFREASTSYLEADLRRIDIRVDFGTFGIGIENKPWAGEQPNQMRDYFLDLERQYHGRFLLLYLSGSGDPPTSAAPGELDFRAERGQYRFSSYREDLANWLEECERECESERFKWFLKDFRSYILRRFN